MVNLLYKYVYIIILNILHYLPNLPANLAGK